MVNIDWPGQKFNSHLELRISVLLGDRILILLNEKLKRQHRSFQLACEQAFNWSGVKEENR